MRRMRTGGGPLDELRVAPVEPDPVFRAVLRDRLVASAARREPPTRPDRLERLRPVRQRKSAGLGPVLAATAFVTAVLVSAQPAICLLLDGERRGPAAQSDTGPRPPGPGADLRRGAKELGEARMRAGRLITLAARREPDPMMLIDAFRAMDGHTRAASEALTRVYARTGELAPLTDLVAFSRDQRTRLRPMLAQLPITALLPAVESMVLICGISEQTKTLLGVRTTPTAS